MPRAYIGVYSDGEYTVYGPDGGKLDPRHDLFNHSPTGFSWGYSGSGPSQLALAILANHLEDKERIFRLYIPFRDTVIAHFQQKGDWSLTEEQIDRAIEHIEDKQ